MLPRKSTVLRWIVGSRGWGRIGSRIGIDGGVRSRFRIVGVLNVILIFAVFFHFISSPKKADTHEWISAKHSPPQENYSDAVPAEYPGANALDASVRAIYALLRMMVPYIIFHETTRVWFIGSDLSALER